MEYGSILSMKFGVVLKTRAPQNARCTRFEWKSSTKVQSLFVLNLKKSGTPRSLSSERAGVFVSIYAQSMRSLCVLYADGDGLP